MASSPIAAKSSSLTLAFAALVWLAVNSKICIRTASSMKRDRSPFFHRLG